VLFNSLEFLIFLPLVLIAFYALPQKLRWVFLLGASYFFYGSWKVEFLSLLVISTITDFYVAKGIESSDSHATKKRWLALSLVVNLGLLFFFKYSSFLLSELLPFTSLSPNQQSSLLHLLKFDLPVGISFYTFQTLGYTIDVYKGKAKAQKNIAKFGLYVSYFPQLVAGPIERYGHLSSQLFKPVKLDYTNLSNGFRLVLYGFFIKMVIADNLAPIVDSVFSTPSEYNSPAIGLGILGFGWQIYADFYGYSLIAIGTAKAMGVNLMDNFKTPYFATSIVDFWRRWHISLSTWFRDYLYLPLGGNKVSKTGWVRNILAVFLLSGIWHGANWTFIIWGAIHAFMYFLERFTPFKWTRNSWWQKFVGWFITYLAVNLAWTFFRANSFAHAQEVLSEMVHFKVNGLSIELSVTVTLMLIVFGVLEWSTRNTRIDDLLNSFPMMARWPLYAILLFCIWAFSGTTQHPFIYFQF
jgi:D-alanyl-lipoteichoic acid acyltransferase DltB (MBOAT superfamily)